MFQQNLPAALILAPIEVDFQQHYRSKLEEAVVHTEGLTLTLTLTLNWKKRRFTLKA